MRLLILSTDIIGIALLNYALKLNWIDVGDCLDWIYQNEYLVIF